jgi:hypothetical protein
MKELNHDNVLPFIGACIDPGEVCYATQHCSRGSVQVRRIFCCFAEAYFISVTGGCENCSLAGRSLVIINCFDAAAGQPINGSKKKSNSALLAFE